jgi:predicted nucleotidyltransferase
MLTNLKNQLPTLIKKHLMDIKLIYLFGSYALNEENDASDIDIAVLNTQKIPVVERWDIQQKIAEALNIDVDLVDLSVASTVLQKQIISKGICLYDANHFVDIFEMKVMGMYQHLNSQRADLLADFKNE